MRSDIWCSLPFMHLSTDPQGSLLPCCKADPIGHVRSASFAAAWNGANLRALRLDFLNNRKSSLCRECWQSEASGITSFRQTINQHFTPELRAELTSNVDPTSGNIARPVQYLELKLSNACNLACRMCSPKFSSGWERLLRQNGPIEGVDQPSQASDRRAFYSASTIQEIRQIVNNPEFKIVCFAGGEPFLDPQHFEFISLIENKREVSYVVNTNLTHLEFKDESILSMLSSFKSVRLIVSIDGDRKRQEYIRAGIDIARFEENLKRLALETDEERWDLNSSAVVSVLNVFHLPELVEYSLDFDLIPLVMTILNGPAHLSLQVLPESARQVASRRLEHWYGEFDLEQYVRSRGLRRVGARLEEAQQNLRASVQSVVAALVGSKFDVHGLGKLRANVQQLDKIHNTSLSDCSPELAQCLRSEAELLAGRP